MLPESSEDGLIDGTLLRPVRVESVLEVVAAPTLEAIYVDLLPREVDASNRRPPVVLDVGGVPFAVTNMERAGEWLIDRAISNRRQARGVAVRLANAYCVALASRDPAYGALLSGEGVNLPDGSPVLWIMRALSRRVAWRPGRVRGPSFFLHVLDLGRPRGLRHYFLGATEETLERLTSEVERRFPGVIVAGAFATPFGPVDDLWVEAAHALIDAVDPDVVWVALGTPKQDVATLHLARRSQRPCVGVGAAFDFTAGTVREAPVILQRCGLEWAFRLCSEPRRLWKRYLIGNVRFTVAAARGIIRTKGRLDVTAPPQD